VPVCVVVVDIDQLVRFVLSDVSYDVSFPEISYCDAMVIYNIQNGAMLGCPTAFIRLLYIFPFQIPYRVGDSS
jgi:hypothetical protein